MAFHIPLLSRSTGGNSESSSLGSTSSREENVSGKQDLRINTSIVTVSDETGLEIADITEKQNPLGYSVGPISVIVLILQGVVGTGIFATPGSILKSMGSIGSSYVLWITCFAFPIINTYVYIEFAGYYPKRNGGDVAYLEQAYKEPKYLIPTMYAAVSVILSFTTSSALAFGQYVLNAAGVEVTTWNFKGVAIGAMTFSCLCVALSTRWSLRLQNLLGFVKVLFMFFMIILGFVILGGKTKVQNPLQHFHNSWEGTTTSANNISNSIIKASFSYGGFQYAFGVVAEYTQAKGASEEKQHKNLMKTYATYVPISLFVIFIMYILMITGYFASATPEEIKKSGISVATLMFKNALENKQATQFLSIMVALSAFGHLVTVVISHSRALRECGRQGVLPFPKFWTSTKYSGTPLGPIFVTWLVNVIMIVAPPAGSAYNFIVDLGSYSGYIFAVALTVGLLKVRRERRLKGLGKEGQYLPLPAIILLLLFELFVIAIAFVPPEGTLIGSDVTFFYATYPLVTIGLLALCVLYYFIWRYALPKRGKYVHRDIIYRLSNGAIGKKIVQVKLEDVAKWDEEHAVDINGVSTIVLEEDIDIKPTNQL